MSLYNIQIDLFQNGLTPTWNTNPELTTFNKNTRQLVYPYLAAFSNIDDPIPVHFSNDRLLTNSFIISSQDNLTTEINDPSPSDDNANLIVSENISKAHPYRGYNN